MVSQCSPRSSIAVIVRLLIAALFVGAGVLKLAGAEPMVAVFATLGAGQWLRDAVGVGELLGALMLLTQRFAGAGAVLLSGIMVGAVATQVAIGAPVRMFSLGGLTITASPIAPAVVLAVLLGIAWTRRSDAAYIAQRMRARRLHRSMRRRRKYEPSEPA